MLNFPLFWSHYVWLMSVEDSAVAHYALDGLPNKVLAAEYKTTLPDAEMLAAEVDRTRKLLEERKRFVAVELDKDH